MFETKDPTKRVIVSGLDTNNPSFNYEMTELANLAMANNFEVVKKITQKLDHPINGTYFGSGKINEIKEWLDAEECDYLVVNDELSPIQIKNLEKMTRRQVIDRTKLILLIFADRAQTKQAKLQVRLAELQYELPRLREQNVSYDQQRGGSALTRGSGETALELNRRTIDKQIAFIKNELVKISKQEATKAQARKKSALPHVALIGYTNAGKSTTLNQILRQYSANPKLVFEKNMLFATLDTSIRRVDLPDKRSIILSDTVGFVSKLPHKLVEAFKATLQEVLDADLLVNVVDVSDSHQKEMIETTKQVLKEIGADKIPMITAYNKIDRTDNYPGIIGDDVYYSARNSIDNLIKLISRKAFHYLEPVTLELATDQGNILNQLYSEGQVLKTEYESDKIEVSVYLPQNSKEKFKQYIKE
ncbi:MAG: GTPase HflX [Lactobacillus sp.]|nr:GTPase HflX [Lactobacillus sp.]